MGAVRTGPRGRSGWGQTVIPEPGLEGWSHPGWGSESWKELGEELALEGVATSHRPHVLKGVTVK